MLYKRSFHNIQFFTSLPKTDIDIKKYKKVEPVC